MPLPSRGTRSEGLLVPKDCDSETVVRAKHCCYHPGCRAGGCHRDAGVESPYRRQCKLAKKNRPRRSQGADSMVCDMHTPKLKLPREFCYRAYGSASLIGAEGPDESLVVSGGGSSRGTLVTIAICNPVTSVSLARSTRARWR